MRKNKIAQWRLRPTPQYIGLLMWMDHYFRDNNVGHSNCLDKVEITWVPNLGSFPLSQHGDLQPTSYEITGIMGMASGIQRPKNKTI